MIRLGARSTRVDGLEFVTLHSRPFSFGGQALRTALMPRISDTSLRQTILFAWTTDALPHGMPLAGDLAMLFVMVDGDDDPNACARWYAARPRAARLHYLCSTQQGRRRLLNAGLPADACSVLRPAVDFAALDRARRGEIRESLSIARDELAWLALPGDAGADADMNAAWATMLIEKIERRVRLLLPLYGVVERRVVNWMRACRQIGMLRVAPASLSLETLLIAADGVVFTPRYEASTGALALAMAAGAPIVASSTPATTEYLQSDRTALLCAPAQPHDAARRMLEVLDQPDAAQLRASLARSQAYEWFSRLRVRDQFARLIENVRLGRNPADAAPDSNTV
ncbi:MAG: glycosyltransferase [Phycisphaerae bacterium]